jgi:hypothetical protein
VRTETVRIECGTIHRAIGFTAVRTLFPFADEVCLVSQSLMQVCRVWSLAASFALIASTAGAQSDRKGGPEGGTWAAEVGSTSGLSVDGAGSSAALLRFFSKQTALVSSFGFSRTERSGSSTFGSNDFSTLALQVGVRRYTRSGLGLRPIIGGGLLVSRISSGGNTDTGIGGYGEAGAAWFFNPHVSLGMTGGLTAVSRDNAWTLSGALARMTAAVYF